MKCCTHPVTIRKGGGTIINTRFSYWKVALEKGGKMKYAITIALLMSLSFGLVTESFRYQSTAQLWEDDYDLLFDPARIPEIEGSRLWTSLSNFVTGSEELFSNGSVPYFLIGGTKNFGKYCPGLVYDRTSANTPLNTGLVDPYGNNIYGEGSVTEIDWTLDTLGNRIHRDVTLESRTAFDKTAGSDYYIAVGTKTNGFRFGLGYLHNDAKTTMTDPNDNYTYYYYEEDYEEDTLEYSDSVTFAGDDITKSSLNEFILSAWLDKEVMSFGGDVRYAMLSDNSEAVITGYEAEYANPESPDHYYTLTSDLDSMLLPESGQRISLNLKMFYDYNDYAQGRYYAGFFMKSTSYGDDALSFVNQTIEDEVDPELTLDTTTTLSDYDGDFSSTGFRAGTKQLFEISDRFRFAFGFFWSMASINDSITSLDSTYTSTVYDDGDPDTLVQNSYNTYSYSTETWVRITEGSQMTFTIPIGVEFNIADPFVIRLGARHSITKNDLTTDNILDAWQPQYTYYDQEDGTTWETWGDPGSRPENSTENDNETIPATSYYYGFGWRVTDNLQIDVMNFSDITDWANWRLSATFHFD
jgi:hypothetical protein